MMMGPMNMMGGMSQMFMMMQMMQMMQMMMGGGVGPAVVDPEKASQGDPPAQGLPVSIRQREARRAREHREGLLREAWVPRREDERLLHEVDGRPNPNLVRQDPGPGPRPLQIPPHVQHLKPDSRAGPQSAHGAPEEATSGGGGARRHVLEEGPAIHAQSTQIARS